MANPQAASPVALEVFDVTELLEAILLELPELDLLLAQRVSKNFQQTITDSKAIRRKLFFERDDDVGKNKNPDANEDPTINPFLEKMYPKASGCWYDIDCDGEDESVICARQNCSAFLDSPIGKLDQRMCVHLPVAYPEGSWLSKVQGYEQASWRRMWASRSAVRVHLTASAYHQHVRREFNAKQMGDLMDHILDAKNWYEATDQEDPDDDVDPWELEFRRWYNEQGDYDYDDDPEEEYFHGGEEEDEEEEDAEPEVPGHESASAE